MALIPCEISEGPRPGYKVVGVKSVQGHTEYLSIEERFLARRNGDLLLPVWLIGRDQKNKTALVQLPYEADSGANRVWVNGDALREAFDEVPA
jgi:hypothetical protein